MHTKPSLLRLVDQLYEAAIDDAALPGALISLADFNGARATCHVTADRRTGAVLSANLINFDPDYQRRYVAYYGAKDLRIPPTLAVPVGETITEHKFLAPSALARSEIYNDFLLPSDIPHIMAIWVEKTQHRLEAVSLQRSHQQGRFLAQDEERYRDVIPHVVRALGVRRRLQAAQHRNAVTVDLIDRLPFGVVFLDGLARVLHASVIARALLRSNVGLQVSNGEIHATYKQDDTQLQRAIQQTLRSRRIGCPPGATVSLSASTGLGAGRTLCVAVVPVRTATSELQYDSCLLLVFDPALETMGAEAAIGETLKVTPSEARLACVLLKGGTLREAADHLHLSVNTCKAQLKSIYTKTGCRSHVELAKLVLFASIGRASGGTDSETGSSTSEIQPTG